MKEQNESIIYLFKSYLVVKKDEKFTLDTEALKKGIVIDSKAPKEIKDLAISAWGTDGYILNQAFHKSLDTVINTRDEDLLLQQIFHYFTTYGFKSIGIYSENTIYIPKEKLEVPGLKEDFKLINITPITKEELKTKLWDLVTSSMALSKTTINDILNLSECLNITKKNIDKVTNRELKVALYDKIDLIPENNIEFLRYLIYKVTGNTLLIKDRETFRLLNFADKNNILKTMNAYEKSYGLEPLSEIFNRYKPLFLSLKTKDYLIDDEDEIYGKKDEEIELNRIINKISKLSKKNHVPFKMNDLDNFIFWYKNNKDKEDYLELLENKLKKENIWRIIKLRNYVSNVNSKIEERVYKIRNNRTWVTTKKVDFEFDKNIIDIFDKFIIAKMKKRLSKKKVYLDKDINIVLPQSEKQFVGNLPALSSIEIKKEDVLFGIHWFNLPYESVDLDLKAVSSYYTIGWDADYKKGNKIVFSGDITDAPYPDGASEYLYFSNDIDFDIISIKVNNYNVCLDDVPFEIIVAKKPKEKITSNYIVDPNDIIVRIPGNLIERNKIETSVGIVVIDDEHIKIVLTNYVTSNRITAENNEVEEALRTYIDLNSIVRCNLRYYLNKVGAVIVDDKQEADIDLSVENLNKNSIIDLLK